MKRKREGLRFDGEKFMSWNFKKELKRKALHIMAIVFIILFIFLSEHFGKGWALFALVALLIIFLEIEYVRVEMRRKISIVWGIWRGKERNRFGGQVFFLIGAIISLAVFEYRIALAGIAMAVFGDMAAALIGKKFGRIWVAKERAIEGILAEFVVNLAIGFVVLRDPLLVFVMATVATVVETFVYQLDDNLLIPIFAGFAGQLTKYLLEMRF